MASSTHVHEMCFRSKTRKSLERSLTRSANPQHGQDRRLPPQMGCPAPPESLHQTLSRQPAGHDRRPGREPSGKSSTLPPVHAKGPCRLQSDRGPGESSVQDRWITSPCRDIPLLPEAWPASPVSVPAFPRSCTVWSTSATRRMPRFAVRNGSPWSDR